MKRIILFTICLFFASFIFAQRMQGNRMQGNNEKIKAMKVAFITQKLNLTVDEAQKFWPVYNEFDLKRTNILNSKQSILRDLRSNFSSYTDKEVEKKLDKRMEYEKQEAELKMSYYQKFKQVLPIKKVASLYSAEIQFKRELIRRLQERRRNNNF